MTGKPGGTPPRSLTHPSPRKPRPPDWVGDLMTARELGVTPDELDAMPAWRVERAELLLAVEGAYHEHQLKEADKARS